MPRLFEWVVSDFGLMESIESGLVKVPRVPCDDDASADQTVWRNLYGNSVRKKIEAPLHEPVDGALSALYADYERVFEAWERARTKTPPVMIVVANTISNAAALYDWIAGANSGTAPSGRATWRSSPTSAPTEAAGPNGPVPCWSTPNSTLMRS